NSNLRQRKFIAQSRRPSVQFPIEWHRYRKSPSPFGLPVWGRGLRRGSDAHPRTAAGERGGDSRGPYPSLGGGRGDRRRATRRGAAVVPWFAGSLDKGECLIAQTSVGRQAFAVWEPHLATATYVTECIPPLGIACGYLGALRSCYSDFAGTGGKCAQA